MRKVIITVVLTLAAVAAFFYFAIVRQGFSVRTKPSEIEEFLIEQARNLATPPADKNMKNPHAETPQGMAQAREHWVDHCAVCHGLDGKGQTDIGRNQYPPVPDMTKEDTQEMTDGQIYSTIVNGVRFSGMPAWGNEHTAEQSWRLVSFIRHLPKLTPDELKQMQPMAAGKQGEHQHQAGEQVPHTHTHPPGTPPRKH
ncbi:MAG: cytochrome c [Acidobacteria bacterium]|jgi:mono/diheme cytochrome c family protein|nr:cytochrome c [Acidobacteriota bacterium]